MNVRAAVLRSLREYDMLSGAHTVVCALSGGADSVCLADVLLSLAPELGFRLECAHFNHMLRGAESDRDERFVRDWCAGRGLTLHIGRGDAGQHLFESFFQGYADGGRDRGLVRNGVAQPVQRPPHGQHDVGPRVPEGAVEVQYDESNHIRHPLRS